MMAFHVVRVLVFFSSLLVLSNRIEGRILSKTILNSYDDTYDCVDFYKQPAFNHPLLKNVTSDYKMIPTRSGDEARKSSKKENNFLNIEIVGEGCPDGTVPIRRNANVNLIEQRIANGGVYYAIARTKGMKYTGAGAIMSIHNPQIKGQRYTATRIKIQNGDESIEAGWRVDPALYGDTQTRFFVRTDAGQAHCFNTLCPGFILQSSRALLDTPFQKISKPGGPVYELLVKIFRDGFGNWNLLLGPNGQSFGQWPSHIFTSLGAFASSIEWGGEAYDPAPIPSTQMGSGMPLHYDTYYDAYFRQMIEYNEQGLSVDANDIEAMDGPYYYVTTQFSSTFTFKRTISYGGPRPH